MPKQISANLVASMMALVVILGAWMLYLRPENAAKWIVVMFMLPGAWGGLVILKRMGAFRSAKKADGDRTRAALAGAGLILAIALGAKVLERLELISGSLSERVMGLVIGGVLVVIGNAIPKTLEPLSETRSAPSNTQALRRFAGWMFVLAGLVYAVVWLVVPVAHANAVATPIPAVAVVLVAGRTAWLYLTRNRSRPAPEG